MMALGGSTNGVLHLLALAEEAKVDLTIDDFNRIGDKVPLIGNLSPSGKVNLQNMSRLLTTLSTMWSIWMPLAAYQS